jgi:hypothetical protein
MSLGGLLTEIQCPSLNGFSRQTRRNVRSSVQFQHARRVACTGKYKHKSFSGCVLICTHNLILSRHAWLDAWQHGATMLCDDFLSGQSTTWAASPARPIGLDRNKFHWYLHGMQPMMVTTDVERSASMNSMVKAHQPRNTAGISLAEWF